MPTNLEKEYLLTVNLLDKRDVGLDKNIFFNKTDYKTATLLVDIRNNGEIVDLEGADIIVSVKKGNGAKSVDNAEILDAKSGRIRITFTPDMLNFPGLATFQITIQKDHQYITSNSFYFTIKKPLIQDEDFTDNEEFPLLIRLKEEQKVATDNANETLERTENLEVLIHNAENVRNENEETRQTQEKERILSFSKIQEDFGNMRKEWHEFRESLLKSWNEFKQSLIVLLEQKADKNHTHNIEEVAKLRTELDSKEDKEAAAKKNNELNVKIDKISTVLGTNIEEISVQNNKLEKLWGISDE